MMGHAVRYAIAMLIMLVMISIGVTYVQTHCSSYACLTLKGR